MKYARVSGLYLYMFSLEYNDFISLFIIDGIHKGGITGTQAAQDRFIRHFTTQTLVTVIKVLQHM